MRIPIRVAGPDGGPFDGECGAERKAFNLAPPDDGGEENVLREDGIAPASPAPEPTPDAADWKDRYVRLLADFENMKRHAEAERERLSGIGKESVLDGVFPLVEHMERARKAVVEAADKDGVLAGLDLVYREILCLLARHGVERVKTAGEVFDPKVHEGVAVVAREGAAPDTVIEELAPGFIRNGKLLRPAMVVVAK